MIHSYLHEIPLKSVKSPLSDRACAPRPNLEKISKIISSILNKNEYFWNSNGSGTNIYKPVPDWSSRQIIINSWRLWNSHQGTNSWGPWYLATFWNVESRKWHFQGFSRGLILSSTADAMLFRQNTRKTGNNTVIVWTFHRSKPV